MWNASSIPCGLTAPLCQVMGPRTSLLDAFRLETFTVSRTLLEGRRNPSRPYRSPWPSPAFTGEAGVLSSRSLHFRSQLTYQNPTSSWDNEEDESGAYTPPRKPVMTTKTTSSTRSEPQRAATNKKSRPTSAGASPTKERSSSQDRGPNGRFVAGNRGGPGNPHARHCARMLDLFRTSISDEDMVRLYRVIFEKAQSGDVSAAKLVLAYKIGKPLPCPDPDSIDRDEWDHFQQDAIEPRAMSQVLNSLPARVGNAIARTALPLMTEARSQELAAQLQPGGQIPQEPIVEQEDKCAKGLGDAPLPIGKTDETNDDLRATNNTSRASSKAPRVSSAQPVKGENSRSRASRKCCKQKATDASRPTIDASRPTANDSPSANSAPLASPASTRGIT